MRIALLPVGRCPHLQLVGRVEVTIRGRHHFVIVNQAVVLNVRRMKRLIGPLMWSPQLLVEGTIYPCPWFPLRTTREDITVGPFGGASCSASRGAMPPTQLGGV